MDQKQKQNQKQSPGDVLINFHKKIARKHLCCSLTQVFSSEVCNIFRKIFNGTPPGNCFCIIEVELINKIRPVIFLRKIFITRKKQNISFCRDFPEILQLKRNHKKKYLENVLIFQSCHSAFNAKVVNNQITELHVNGSTMIVKITFILDLYSKFTGEHPCKSVISIKLKATLLKSLHGCSSVNLLHIFRIPFPKNIFGGLLLSVIN